MKSYKDKNIRYQKIRKKILNILQWVLIFLSLIAILFILVNACKLSFQFTEKGFQNFLSLFQPYSFLFGATFIVISSNLALERLWLMNQANLKSFKASDRTIWMQTIKDFYSEVRDNDPYVVKEFNKNLTSIYDYLYELNFKFDNKEQVKDFLDKFFVDNIDLFESMNELKIRIKCYANENHTYSHRAFEYLLHVCLEIKNCYKNFIFDLFDLYMIEVKKVQQKSGIDNEQYNKLLHER